MRVPASASAEASSSGSFLELPRTTGLKIATRSVVADWRDMRDQAGLGRPGVERKARRLEDKSDGLARAKIKRQLMRHSGHNEADRAGPATGDGAMVMAGDHAFNFRMAFDKPRECAVGSAHRRVHPADTGNEGWVMHEDQRRATVAFSETIGKPSRSCGADSTADLSRHHRVEADEPNWKILDNVMQKILSLAQIGIGRGEAVAHRLAPVVIARNDEYRHCQAGQDINHESVLVQAPAIGKIARDEDAIGNRVQGSDRGNGAPRHGIGVDASIYHLANGMDMEVANLRNEHGKKSKWRDNRGPVGARAVNGVAPMRIGTLPAPKP
jgi:hypothetical protein